MEIFKTSERLYRRFLVILIAITITGTSTTSHAGAKNQKIPNPHPYRVDNNEWLDARVNYAYESGYTWGPDGTYEQEIYCEEHSKVNCPGGGKAVEGKPAPQSCRNKKRDDKSRPKMDYMPNGRTRSVEVNHVRAMINPTLSGNFPAQNGVNHQFSLGSTTVFDRFTNPDTVEMMGRLSGDKESKNVEYAEGATAMFTVTYGIVNSMANQAAPRPGISVIPKSNPVYTFHPHELRLTGLVNKDSDGDGVHYHLSGGFGGGSVNKELTGSGTQDDKSNNYAVGNSGTANYTLTSHDDFGEGQSASTSGTVIATEKPTVTINNVELETPDARFPYVLPWTKVVTTWSTKGGNGGKQKNDGKVQTHYARHNAFDNKTDTVQDTVDTVGITNHKTTWDTGNNHPPTLKTLPSEVYGYSWCPMNGCTSSHGEVFNDKKIDSRVKLVPHTPLKMTAKEAEHEIYNGGAAESTTKAPDGTILKGGGSTGGLGKKIKDASDGKPTSNKVIFKTTISDTPIVHGYEQTYNVNVKINGPSAVAEQNIKLEAGDINKEFDIFIGHLGLKSGTYTVTIMATEFWKDRPGQVLPKSTTESHHTAKRTFVVDNDMAKISLKESNVTETDFTIDSTSSEVPATKNSGYKAKGGHMIQIESVNGHFSNYGYSGPGGLNGTNKITKSGHGVKPNQYHKIRAIAEDYFLYVNSEEVELITKIGEAKMKKLWVQVPNTATVIANRGNNFERLLYDVEMHSKHGGGATPTPHTNTVGENVSGSTPESPGSPKDLITGPPEFKRTPNKTDVPDSITSYYK